jgi:iron(III) transport system ATP-binding protein
VPAGPFGLRQIDDLRIIAGVERQDAGDVLVDGEVVSDDHRHAPPEARGIGLMFQDFALFPHLSVADNVAFGLRGDGRRSARGSRSFSPGCGSAGTSTPIRTSCRAASSSAWRSSAPIAPRPRVMLMDEPFSGLDNRLRDGVRDETLEILKEEGAAVLLVTHEPEEAMRMADEIALMRAGRIVQRGAPYNVYNAPVDRNAAAFFSDINVIRGVVHGALTDTPFGQFLAPGVPDGTEVEIVIRPQHLRIDFDRNGRGPNPTPQDGIPARAVVERARYMGHESLVELRLEHDGRILKATVPSVFLPKPGTALWIMFRRERCFVFPVRAAAEVD